MIEPHTDAGATWERRYGGTISPAFPRRRSPLPLILTAWVCGIAAGIAAFLLV